VPDIDLNLGAMQWSHLFGLRSLFAFVVIGIFNSDHSALGAQPAFAGAGVSADIGGVMIGDDVKDEGFGSVVVDLMGITWMADEMISCHEAQFTPMISAQDSCAGKDDVKLRLCCMRVHGEVCFPWRQLGLFNVKGMTTSPGPFVFDPTKRQRDVLAMKFITSLWRKTMLNRDFGDVDLVHIDKVNAQCHHARARYL